jgi:phosphopantothenoylcysteine decarboxylase/phosphopantothenate--cysteine ligase
MFGRADGVSPDHLALTEQADLLLVAPATANILAKAACGICDDLLSTLIAASACPVVFAPAMNARMWLKPICQENVARLRRHGYAFIGPEEGWLAERTRGPGRLAEPQAILAALTSLLSTSAAPAAERRTSPEA